MSDPLPANVSRVRVRMFHTDAVGSVFHGRIFDIFEEGRTEAFRRLGFEWGETEAAGIGMIVYEVAARFHRPAVMEDALLVATFVEQTRPTTLTIRYEVQREATAEVLATGSTVFAFVNKATRRPVRVPEAILAAARRCPGMLIDATAQTG
jgi:acyl-CoA thioester hydrolase